ncbi:enamine deaminase RidA [Reticulibacter mediterranei]|uniref:Enamine deaminase RidA n=1 Tax=Reticulibacter mediterranei TaxID=2778369 RepID=A0A8J3N9G8_9CHLR|nr:RidA family protein [Reticulibacter mediterranei]GHP00571.1 enamine deaminase RidA [Reticulibacter mediterranei]
MAEHTEAIPARGLIEYFNPEPLHKNPAFTQVISVSGPVKTVYVGGQNAVDAQGNIVGKGDIKAQVQQVLANLREALAAAGAGPEYIIKWNIYLTQGQSVHEGLAVFQQFWGNHPNPPAITMLYVSGLANLDFLLEMEAIAVVPLA